MPSHRPAIITWQATIIAPDFAQLGTCLNFADLRCVRTPILPCSRARFLRKALKLVHDFCATSSSNYPPDPDIGPTSIPTPIDRSLILSNLCCLFTPYISHREGFRRLHNNLIMANITHLSDNAYSPRSRLSLIRISPPDETAIMVSCMRTRGP
jgi:hypothetical protein